jgi:hypothetical protein
MRRHDPQREVWLPIKCIAQSKKLQRKMCREKVESYRQLLEAGRDFPPIRVLLNGDCYTIRDGRHRYLASREAGHSHMKAVVINA